MSFISSGRQSSTPSILKRPGKLKSTPVRTVKFQLDHNLKGLLVNYLTEKNRDAYVELICKIRDAGDQLTDDELIQIISETKDCISILNEHLKLFVQVLLLLKWAHRSDEAVQLYKNFILDLCSAHNYYTKFALQQLVAVFSTVIENSYHSTCLPSEQEERSFQSIHEVLRSLLKIIPMSKEVLLNVIKRKFPFRTESARSHLNYVHNVLTIASYEPVLRREILTLVITKLIHLDTLSSKEEIEIAESSTDVVAQSNEVFSMEIDDVAIEEDMRHETARKLDFCLHRLYSFIHAECHDKNDVLKWEKVKTLYQDLLYIFETVILPTYGCIHTQFVLLYFISFKRKLTEDFANYLWNKVTNPNIAPVMRQAAVCYLAGMLSHASFVSVNIVKTMLENMSNWLHQYSNNVDIRDDDVGSLVRIHGVFYATCQALFYLMNTRHGDFVNCDKDLKFLTNLRLSKIVTCRLNPLFVCSRAIVNQFARVTKTYQLAYCETVLSTADSRTKSMSVSDLWLDGYFPFECYLLKKSNTMVSPIHRQVNEILCKDVPVNVVNDDDDFSPVGSLSQSPLVPVLSASPFFGCTSFGS